MGGRDSYPERVDEKEMSYRSNFERDLQRGNLIEERVLRILKKSFPEARRVKGYCKEGDIYLPECEKWVEVKYDPMSQQTGNIVVEVEFNGKPSALSTTKSYRWVFYTGKELIITSPKILRKMIEDNGLSPVEFVGNGDKHSKLAYLVKKHHITDTAIRVVSPF
jgi:hypothetical protein